MSIPRPVDPGVALALGTCPKLAQSLGARRAALVQSPITGVNSSPRGEASLPTPYQAWAEGPEVSPISALSPRKVGSLCPPQSPCEHLGGFSVGITKCRGPLPPVLHPPPPLQAVWNLVGAAFPPLQLLGSFRLPGLRMHQASRACGRAPATCSTQHCGLRQGRWADHDWPPGAW